MHGEEGNPDGRRFRLSGERFATYGGWTNQLAAACSLRLRGNSTRSADRTLDALQRSAPSLGFMRFEAESSGFIPRGSFFKAIHLPARTHGRGFLPEARV
jgi:hypothetical protein